MRQTMIGLVLGASVLGVGCGGGGGAVANDGTTANQQAAPTGGVTYSIMNASNYDIHYIFISPTSQSTWGPDLLGPTQVLGTGQSLTFTGVACDRYDLKLVDEDADECIQSGVEICQNSALIIRNEDLLECEGYR